jgi:putative transposase
MPRKANSATTDKKSFPDRPAELLQQWIPGQVTPAQFEGNFLQFKKAFIQQAMGAEMSHHLGYAPGQAKPMGTTNHRNGKSAKTVLTDTGAVDIEVPRDRQGSFEPQIVGKHERRFSGFDDKIIAMDARGMTVRDIQAFLNEMYAVDV